MTFRDSVSISFQNLWTQKIRTFLTVSGVIIAIATFVAMLAFGLGIQENVTTEIQNSGILNSVQVTPLENTSEEDSVEVAVLDSIALAKLEKIPGIRIAYPFSSFTISATVNDTTLDLETLSLPEAASESELLSNLVAGHSDFAKGDAIITEQLTKKLGFENPGAAVGEQLIVEVKVANIDSAFSYAARRLFNPMRLVSILNFDSLGSPQLVGDRIQSEVSQVFSRFLYGYFQMRETITDTMTVRGVVDKNKVNHFNLKPLIIPVPNAEQLQFGGTSDDPVSMFSAIQDGTFFTQGTEKSTGTFSKITLEMENNASYESIKKAVEELGFKAYSLTENFKQIRNVFIFFDFALGIIGFIALLVASLGIANTMIMSIVERKKEIGVFKSLGATNGQIRGLYLMETGVIGFFGSVFGLILGSTILGIAKFAIETYLAGRDVDISINFHIPMWLIFASIAFGVFVSIVAGLYPAGRAASVDPVESLRGE